MPRQHIRARRVTRRADVDEAKERRPQFAILGREVHRLLVERLEGVAALPGERSVDRATDLVQLILHMGNVPLGYSPHPWDRWCLVRSFDMSARATR